MGCSRRVIDTMLFLSEIFANNFSNLGYLLLVFVLSLSFQTHQIASQVRRFERLERILRLAGIGLALVEALGGKCAFLVHQYQYKFVGNRCIGFWLVCTSRAKS